MLRIRHQRLGKHQSEGKYADTYDANKYAEMLLDVAESVLGVFGFSRTQLGFYCMPRNFLEELRGERGKEVLLELESLEDGLTRPSSYAFPETLVASRASASVAPLSGAWMSTGTFFLFVALYETNSH